MDSFNSIVINRIQDRTQSPLARVDAAFVTSVGFGVGVSIKNQTQATVTAMPSIVIAYERTTPASSRWQARFEEIKSLKKGWNGYTAPIPSDLAIKIARSFTDLLIGQDYPPSKISATVVGGVATTLLRGVKRVFVEFYNDGTILALFSDDSKDDEPEIDEVKPEFGSLKSLIDRMRSFLDG